MIETHLDLKKEEFEDSCGGYGYALEQTTDHAWTFYNADSDEFLHYYFETGVVSIQKYGFPTKIFKNVVTAEDFERAIKREI